MTQVLRLQLDPRRPKVHYNLARFPGKPFDPGTAHLEELQINRPARLTMIWDCVVAHGAHRRSNRPMAKDS
jgi:hypothetical protein